MGVGSSDIVGVGAARSIARFGDHEVIEEHCALDSVHFGVLSVAAIVAERPCALEFIHFWTPSGSDADVVRFVRCESCRTSGRQCGERDEEASHHQDCW